MEPLVPTQQNGNPNNTLGIPGTPVNTNVTLADKARAEAALASVQQNNQVITPTKPDYSKLQVNMSMPSLTPAQEQVMLEEMAKSGSPVVTMEDVKNGGIVVDGKSSTQQSQPKEVNTGGNNIMNNQMQQPVNNVNNAGGMNMNQNMNQYQPQYQMPMQQQQIQPQPQEEGFFSNPTVKTVGIGVACAAAGYLGHKYLSGSDSAEIAAALGELL